MLKTDVLLSDCAQQIPQALILVEPGGRLVWANHTALYLFDLPADVNDVHLESLLDDPPEKLQRYLKLCARSTQPLPSKLIIKKKHGDPISCMVSGGRILGTRRVNELPRILMVIEQRLIADHYRNFAALNDSVSQLKQQIIARKKTESLLEAEKIILSKIVSGVSLGDALELLVLTIEDYFPGSFGSILMMSDEGRLYHGASPNLPKSYTRQIDGLKIGPSVGSCGTAAYSGETIIVTDTQSDPRWVNYRELAREYGIKSCWSTPIFSSTNSILGTFALYFSTVRSSTELEHKLIKNSAHIASLAIERHRTQQTLAMLLRKEQQERERVENENRIKDNFLAMLSHEIRNPLGAIANVAHTLEALGTANKEQAALQEILINESMNLRCILNDLLDMARLNSGKVTLNLEKLDMAKMVTEAVSILRIAHPKRILVTQFDNDVGWISGDRTRIQQIIKNLVDNAFKYSDEGDRVTLTVASDDRNCILKVLDVGIGMDADALNNVFNPFIQSVRPGKHSDGLGLGLSLVREFVELHGGSVSASSAGVGQGSEFIVRFPLIEAPLSSKSIPTSSRMDRFKHHVLIVEDHKNARNALVRLLELRGHRVSSASDGEQALQIILHDPPDIALVDIGLPGMNGYELAGRIRSDFSEANIKLIALTGYGESSDRKKAKEAGFCIHLVKPVDVVELGRIFEALGPTHLQKA